VLNVLHDIPLIGLYPVATVQPDGKYCTPLGPIPVAPLHGAWFTVLYP